MAIQPLESEVTHKGRRATTGTLLTGAGKIHYILLVAGADAATATIYDATSATGTPIASLSAAATDSIPFPLGSKHLVVGTGIHIVLSGTAPFCYVGVTEPAAALSVD